MAARGGELSAVSESDGHSSPESLLEDNASSVRVLLAYLVVQVTMVLGLVWKWSYFVLSDKVYHNLELVDPFFPDLLRDADVVRWAYLGSLLFIGIGCVGCFRWVQVSAAVLCTGCLSVLCLHQASYNDATFTTSFWASVWVVWYTTRMNRDSPESLLLKAAFLSRAIGSMVLLGGAVGKWTPEYWSGEVFYDIYFSGRDFWTFNLLREKFDVEELQTIAMWYSRLVVVTETVVGFGLWKLPTRAAALVGVCLFTSIAVFSNWLLFSVVLALIGLSLVGLLVPKEERSEAIKD